MNSFFFFFFYEIGLSFKYEYLAHEWIAIECSRLYTSVYAWSSLGEQFLRFSKNFLFLLNRILLLFETRKSCVFQIFLLRSIKAYFCPNIIKFDSVDFSERRPEEVISFFWRSVYIAHILSILHIFLQKDKTHSENFNLKNALEIFRMILIIYTYSEN